MTTPSRPVTLQRLADLAGVSKMTVSKALRDGQDISDATKARIKTLADELGYIPNLLARGLTAQSTRLIGAVVPRLSDPTFADTLDGLSSVVEESGYQLIMAESRYSPDSEAAQIKALIGRRIDGLALFSAEHHPGVRELIRSSGMRVVELWSLPAEPLGGVAGFSNEEVGRAGARHFLERGYRRVAFADSDYDRGLQRWTGFKHFAKIHCMEAKRFRLGKRGERFYESYAEGERLGSIMAAAHDVEAILIADDIVAVAALHVVQSLGRRVPDNLAICGVGNLRMSAFSNPPLTTIDVSAHAIGVAAGHMLVNSPDVTNSNVCHDVQVVMRRTS